MTTHWRHRPGPPTFWTKPDGGREPFCAPTEKELFDLLGKLGHSPMDEALRDRLSKILVWLLYGEQILSPRGMTSKASIELMRYTAFCQGTAAVGYSKAGAWAANHLKGMPAEGGAHTMEAAYKQVQRRLGQEQRRPLTHRPNRT
jgi:hypothetical protein